MRCQTKPRTPAARSDLHICFFFHFLASISDIVTSASAFAARSHRISAALSSARALQGNSPSGQLGAVTGPMGSDVGEEWVWWLWLWWGWL